MKIFILLIFFLFNISTVYAGVSYISEIKEEIVWDEIDSSSFATFSSNLFLSTTFIVPTMLTIQCGEGSINISLKTGEAEFVDCDPDEASKALFEGIKPFFEEWRDEICDE